MDDTGNSEDESSDSSSGVFWRIVLICILIGSDGAFWKAFWLLVHKLLLATFRLVRSEEFWYPRWTNHQASPALYQRSGCMKAHTLEHPEGRHVVK